MTAPRFRLPLPGTVGPRVARGVVGVLLVAGLALATGCRAPRTPFPLGVYSVTRTTDLPEVRAAGFNVVLGEASPELLDGARSAGLQVIARPGTQAGERFDGKRARDFVRHFDRHEALRAWMISDEPDLHGIPPAEVALARDALKTAGARKPTAVVLFDGNQAARYATQADWLIQDRYPIPWLPLADFGKHLRLARLAAGPRRPLYAVVQAFDWSAHPDQLPGETGLRPPTAAEMRAMTYLALVRGADGILYYTFDDGRWDIRRHPETWQALRDIAAEVRLHEPLFLGRRHWPELDFAYPDRETRRNEALDPAVQAVVVEVDAAQADDFVPAGEYLVAVNTMNRDVPWRFRDGTGKGAAALVPVLGEGRFLAGQKGWFGEVLGPYAVRVYGPLGPAKTAR